MSYNPNVKNILTRIREHAKKLYEIPLPYPVTKQNLGTICICPSALRRMATNLIKKGHAKDQLIEVEGVIMDLDENQKDVFCYYTEGSR